MEFDGAFAVFLVTLCIMFAFSFYGSIKAKKNDSSEEDLAGRSLNKWLVGLSSAATGNSGFIVTGAVGLGYTLGLQALWLPIAWFIGDLIFWQLFPSRLNRVSREYRSITLLDFLSEGLRGYSVRFLILIVSTLLIILLTFYTSAQWIAGRKFLTSVYQFSDVSALLFFSGTIVLYSAIGGFRGSVLVDTVQAVIRIMGTVLAIVAISWAAMKDSSFVPNINTAGEGFMDPFSIGSMITLLGFVSGFAFAAIGFGLGQPQIVSRYFAGNSPEDTAKAKWICIGFSQFTWMTMTIFGILLRGLMPELPDAEEGLGHFFKDNFPAIVAGIIFADVYATIAASSNSVLVSISQIINRDFLGALFKHRVVMTRTPFYFVIVVGVVSVVVSLFLPQNVFHIIVGSVSLIGASVGSAVMIKVMKWKHNGISLLLSVMVGFLSAFLWRISGIGEVFNESGVGIFCALCTNFAVCYLSSFKSNDVGSLGKNS
ncbi:sodium:solute symporter family transporter [Pseudoalteromonas luteoviolacea]|uniref:Sodium/proline symporter n=1 Tax=Pseudoalteromonas luteoviolacea NCIMB 1942 TaxID=1365253 RepID=A0A166YQ05_9GAMM|nr:hypothetical protein [Pseudoalteromonas luteoviolacea]KZN43249.1 hypothetical protein N482_19180 [Pseudoalteromonas luteoviolacea NCIMB 1942]KZX00366.1 hypothetical protein JL49_11840 [Pseudoalteromonas luteoviolacea]